MTTAITKTDNAPERCAPAAGSARPTLQDLRAHLTLMRDGVAPAKYMAARHEESTAGICQNLAVVEAALTATIMAVEAQIKAQNSD